MQSKLINDASRIELRRKLRQDATKSERVLWGKLRGNQLGHKFRRQVSIGPYVVDFCCLALRLIIEIDGLSHNSDKAFDYDAERQKYLEQQGFKVLRYQSQDVFYKLVEVSEDIYQTCIERAKDVTSP